MHFLRKDAVGMRALYELRENGEKGFQLSSFSNMNFPLHLHRCFELLFVLSGEILVTVNGSTFAAKAGEAAAILPDEIHSYRTPAASGGILMIFPESCLPGNGGLLHGKALRKSCVPLPDSGAEEFFRAYRRDDPFRELQAAGYFCSLLYRIVNLCGLRDRAPDDGGDLLRRVVTLAYREYDRPVSIRSAAAELGVCRASVTRVLKASTGCGFQEYIGLLRAEKARRMLVQTNLPVLDIALECGYDSGRSFGRAFRRFTGQSPSGFRASAGK